MNETHIAPKAETSTGQKALVLSPTIEPQRAPVIEAPENPDVIEIEFSEVDRMTAKSYRNNEECMFCTALRNRGINVTRAGGFDVTTEYGQYEIPAHYTKTIRDFDIHDHRDEQAEKLGVGPFWRPSIVGKKVTLRRKTTSVPSA